MKLLKLNLICIIICTTSKNLLELILDYWLELAILTWVAFIVCVAYMYFLAFVALDGNPAYYRIRGRSMGIVRLPACECEWRCRKSVRWDLDNDASAALTAATFVVRPSPAPPPMSSSTQDSPAPILLLYVVTSGGGNSTRRNEISPLSPD